MPDAHAACADLTERQLEAVTHRDGPLLVLAGPGSGKTTVVTRRVAALISSGVPPWQILALTFTNKAAGEMRERIARLLPDEGELDGRPTVSTFHSFCARQLRRFAEEARLAPRFTVYDAADQREAIKRAIERAEMNTRNWTPASVASAISRAKDRLLDAAAYAQQADDFYTRSVARVFAAYETILRENDAVDFDDLLVRTAVLLRENEAVCDRLQRRYRYLLLDEYQDTNHAQFVIAHTLAAAHRNICVVGDPDQSIYGWRGADIGNILEFEEHYPEAAVVKLGENFRSTGHIVETAASLIRHNRRRKHKDLHTRLGDGEPPEVVICRDEHHEARLVADALRRRREEQGVPWREMAVLYRVNALSRVLEAALRDARIPYVIARGTAFFERKEIKDALSYLRLVANPSDEVSLRRVVNTPPRGIGATTIGRLERFAVAGRNSLWEAMRRAARTAGAVEGLDGRACGAVRRFVELVEGLRRDATAPGTSTIRTLPDLVSEVVRVSGLEKLYGAQTEEERQRRENLGELISAAAQFVPLADDTAPFEEDMTPLVDADGRPDLLDELGGFLESISLVSDADMVDPERGVVTLMTLHAAKGLEFDFVTVVGLEDMLLPHARAADSEAALEEERRLCFVGMTRAKRRLLLTRAAVRTHRGLRERTLESRFLGELSPASITRLDLAGEVGFDAYDEGLDFADLPDPPDDEFEVGCLVRHPRFGLGRVESIMRRARGASARVDFPTVGTKTLILEHARLERVR